MLDYAESTMDLSMYQSHAPLRALVAQHVPDEHFLELEEDDKATLYKELLRYLFHQRYQRDFQSEVRRRFRGPVPKTILALPSEMAWDPVQNSTYKLGILRWVHGETKNLIAPGTIDAQRELEWVLDRSDTLWDDLRSPEILITPVTLDHQEQLISKLLIQIRPMIVRFTYNKLRFIATSNRMRITDLVQDLAMKVLQVMRWQYPFKSELHIFNSAVQSVRNTGVNMIHYYNAQKRRRLSDISTGAHTNLIEQLQEDIESGISDDRTEDDLINSALINNIVYRFEGMDRTAVRLMLYQDCGDHFLEWARQNVSCRSRCETLEELAGKIGNVQYHQAISQYLRLPPSKMTEVSATIRQLLA